MQVRELSIPDAWVFTPDVHTDSRGEFHEFYRFERVEETVGHALALKQGNASISSRGVLRGVHYALVPPSQAKYVTAVRGAFIDFVIDLRIGSPTFGRWDSVLMDDVDHRSVYLSEGLGHAILALTDAATVNYLVSEVYNPSRELGINPLDPELALDIGELRSRLNVGEKDSAAPSLAAAAAAGSLPSYAECLDFYKRDRA